MSHLGQCDPFSAQIWSPWFEKLQMKQQGDLDDASGNYRLLNILEKIKSNNSLGFKEDFEREIIQFLSKYRLVVFLRISFKK